MHVSRSLVDMDDSDNSGDILITYWWLQVLKQNYLVDTPSIHMIL